MISDRIKYLTIISVVLVVFPFYSFAQTNAKYGKTADEKMQEKMIPGAKLGHLICLDEFGNWMLCTGSEFEKIKGFATSVPYVTANKILEPGKSKIEFMGIASVSAGIIVQGDYLCPCEQNVGMVKKCDKTDFPYAKAISGATNSGENVRVKVLGYRR